ncbi:hypothetical protein DPMN_046612 [Dreissena polymorpha]|uniref:Uncharacterized protein n=1 Tax=Dreissena polymorpha TaxID=45954 RepID=A0A9D4D756_DREPO|nr:hypothetical protein DPMN_046612 [Dreissena polymorpha]
MAQTFNNMGRKLVKVAVLVLLFSKGVFLTKAAKLKNSSPLLVTYEDKITTSAVSRFACFSLCNEGCRFVVYSDRGSDAGVASGFIKVRTRLHND